MHISNCRQEINTYTLAHAPLSLLTVTRGTLAAYHDHMETEVDFGSWTLVETVAWAKKAFGDDVSASFEGLRKCYDVHVVGRSPTFAYWRKVGYQAYTWICTHLIVLWVINT